MLFLLVLALLLTSTFLTVSSQLIALLFAKKLSYIDFVPFRCCSILFKRGLKLCEVMLSRSAEKSLNPKKRMSENQESK